jgi:MFS family permease
VRRAAIGVLALFVACGFTFASWASRLVAVRQGLGLDPGQMGLLLLCWSAGSVAAMPLSGRMIKRFGGRQVLVVFGGIAAAGLVGAGFAAGASSVPAVGALLFALGVGIGVWDVTMNVAATDVEHALARSVMPRFHAGYSLGTVLAGGIGAGLARLGLPVAAHFALVAALGLAALFWGVSTLLPGGALGVDRRAKPRPPGRAANPDRRARTQPSGQTTDAPHRAEQPRSSEAPAAGHQPGRARSNADADLDRRARTQPSGQTTDGHRQAEQPRSSEDLESDRQPKTQRPGEALADGHQAGRARSDGAATPDRARSTWGEPRVLLVGLVVLALSLAEGAAGDWLASGIVQGFGTPEAVGIAGLTVFLTSQTAVRVFGTRLVDRVGRPAAIRGSGLLAMAGVALYALAPGLPLVFVGAALWGAGAALVFPLGMSAAGDDPARAAARTSVVATIGYGAFLTGPPLLGLLADHVGFRLAMLALAAPSALAVVFAWATRPERGLPASSLRV